MGKASKGSLSTLDPASSKGWALGSGMRLRFQPATPCLGPRRHREEVGHGQEACSLDVSLNKMKRGKCATKYFVLYSRWSAMRKNLVASWHISFVCLLACLLPSLLDFLSARGDARPPDETSCVIKISDCDSHSPTTPIPDSRCQIPQLASLTLPESCLRLNLLLSPTRTPKVRKDKINTFKIALIHRQNSLISFRNFFLFYDIHIYVLSSVYTVYTGSCLSCKHASMPQLAAMGFQCPKMLRFHQNFPLIR
jgi:hypothetical protein